MSLEDLDLGKIQEAATDLEKQRQEKIRDLRSQRTRNAAMISGLRFAGIAVEENDEDLEHRLSQLTGVAFEEEEEEEPEPTPEPTPAPVAEPTPEPTPDPTLATPVVEEEEEDEYYNWYDPRGWGFLPWLLAIIGALIGLYVGAHTADSASGDIDNGLFDAAWVIASGALGFFIGGTIGAFIVSSRSDDETDSE